MKLKFKTQAYQTAAVQAVVDCFKGQAVCHHAQRYPLRMHGYNTVSARDRLATPCQVELEKGALFSNADVTLSEAELLKNIQVVQQRQHLPLSNKLITTPIAKINLDIEMETGTGKTYCYIKTLFELNRHYGWSKFIIVVPSIAIREGVATSLQITAAHFLETYQQQARVFIYNSKQLHHLESFASDAGINIMVINVQAFAARGVEQRRIYEVLDDFQSRRPIDVISINRPILILDEPQKMEGNATLQSLEAFKPLMILRYSATHKTTHNTIYKLDAQDAYHQKLVKKIAVRGISIKNQRGARGYLYLQSIHISSKKAPEADVEFEQRQADGHIKRVLRRLAKGDNLFVLSRGLNQYRDGFVVGEINAYLDSLSFTNGIELTVGEAMGDVSEARLRRIQIREAINAHFDKEERLFQQGIKVLTLFFIDEVVKYRDYTAPDEKGDYARIFEEEYQYQLNDRIVLGASPYIHYLKAIPSSKTHCGYFSIDKKSKRIVDPGIIRRGEQAGLSDDVEAYDLILKDKERLLSFDEPVRFLFSHSALREGWDNPNVFVICALKHSDHRISRRQEVGRGLRLCVNQNGERMDHPTTVHEINVLTVVANESYQEFVAGLQRDIGPSFSQLPEPVNERQSNKRPDGTSLEPLRQPSLRQLNTLPTLYQFDSATLVQQAIRALNDPSLGLKVSPVQYVIQHGEQASCATQDRMPSSTVFELKTSTTSPRTMTDSTIKYDLVGELSEATQLTRRAIVEILKGVHTEIFAQFQAHPEGFMAEAIRLINEQKISLLNPKVQRQDNHQ